MDPLERQVADAINVEPSPDFVARVRARVATEPAPASTGRWPLLAAGLAAALAVTIYVQRPDRGRAVTGANPVAVVPRAAPASAPMSVPRVEPASAPVVRRRGRTMPEVPEVIVAADQVRGFHVLDDLVRRDGATLIFEDETDRGPAQQLSVQEIRVAPIQVAPIALASTVTEGDEQ